MVNKNNKREPQLTLNSAKQRLVFYFAQMLLKEVLTSHQLIGLSNMTHPMIQKIISIESVVLPEELTARVEPSYSS
jgi:hypothetical protein